MAACLPPRAVLLLALVAATFYRPANGKYTNGDGEVCEDCPAAAPTGCDTLIDPLKYPGGARYNNPSTCPGGMLHHLLSPNIVPTGEDWPWWVCARKCAELKECVYWSLHERSDIVRNVTISLRTSSVSLQHPACPTCATLQLVPRRILGSRVCHAVRHSTTSEPGEIETAISLS